MSAASASAQRGLVPFARGYDPRRITGPRMSTAELAFRKALDEEHIPKASEALAKIFAQAFEGVEYIKDSNGMFVLGPDGSPLAVPRLDVKAAELWFKICGLIRKPTDDAALQDLAKALVDGMIVEARARREQP